ncbi:DeoR/GlpR family DNA-binding transcription regulator [Varibaculum vaginae]|uniref:DeoR/GlpR family DNA-binding transcription regulator n=1 Tax=Varibaculum vaginae TaxID=2364797 RepID=UPI000F08A769|nr:DeoR/GlpR family DNA-binding transcription regulator [Varibaculum vaginae]
MLAHQRHDEILRQVNQNGSVRVTDLVTQLDVSEMTVRRDIQVLATKGLLERVHGGAVRIAGASEEGNLATSAPSGEEKILAQAALETIRPGSSVFIGGGGCGPILAKLITESDFFSSLTVATNCLPVAKLLDRAQQEQRNQGRVPAQVIIFGGQPEGHENLGPLTLANAHNFYFHSVFIEAEGMDKETGLSCGNLDKAALKQVLIRNCEFATVMVPARSWGRTALNVVCPLKQLSRVISATEPPTEIAEALTQSQIMLDIRQLDSNR